LEATNGLSTKTTTSLELWLTGIESLPDLSVAAGSFGFSYEEKALEVLELAQQSGVAISGNAAGAIWIRRAKESKLANDEVEEKNGEA
jgi:hypothetical protein